MSKQTLKFEYIKPTNIESEVPDEQKLREPTKNDNDSSNDSNTEQEKDENFVPVLTIRKEETTLTKGDLKLQKVWVTENFAEENKSNTVINPLYSEVQSTVISGTQPIRECPKATRIGDDYKDKMEDKEKKPKTKIPTLNFKQTVEKVKRERNYSSQEQDKAIASSRRSSIPKLRRKRNSTSKIYDSTKINANIEHNVATKKKAAHIIKPDEEFEKLFEEIVDDKQVEAVAEELLSESFEDPDKLETSFEEIIHAYDENKIQRVMKENKNCKIPLNKQKSLNNESKQNQEDRRLSLNNISLNKEEKHFASQIPKIKVKAPKEVSKIPVVNNHKNTSIVYTAEDQKVNSNVFIKAPKDENSTKSLNKECNNTTRNDNSSLLLIGEREKSEQPSENLDKDSKSDKVEKETVNVEFVSNNYNPSANILTQPEATNITILENDISKMPYSSKMVMSMFPMNDDNKKRTQPMNKPKSSIFTHIALFQAKEARDIKQNINDTINDSINHQSLYNEKYDNFKTLNIDVKQSDQQLKEGLELYYKETTGTKNRESIQENLKKDPFKIIHNKNYTSTTYEDVKNNTSEANCIGNEINNAKPEEVPKLRGNISDIISRINSNDRTQQTPKKVINIDIPKKTCVFSKIAIFEHQSSKEPLKIKEDLPQNKVQVQTLKEIDINEVEHREPKIIDTVLKFQPLRKSDIEEYVSDEILEPAQKNTTYGVRERTSDVIGTNKDICIRQIETENENTLKETEQSKHTESLKLEETLKSDLDTGKFDSSINNDSKKENTIKTHDIQSRDLSLFRLNSVAKLDTVKQGKVLQMVVRMNSRERIEFQKKEVINLRESPRKKSVSERIALFERKPTPVKLENTEITNVQIIQSTPRYDNETNNFLPKSLSEGEYTEKIKDLEKASQVYGKIENMPYVKLRNGKLMPVLSVGTALLDPRLIQPVIKAAIDLGYRAIDAAFIYGNEKEIGDAIRAKIDDGTITRAELFIVNKLWNSFHRPDLVEVACKASLAAMGLDYFDLYLVHSPISFKEGKEVVPTIANVIQYSTHDYMDAWYGMEELVNKGLVKSIGVSNFNAKQLSRVYEKARHKPVINQVECHPYLSQQRLAQVGADRDIKLSCFGVLGSKGAPAELKANLHPVIDDPTVMVMAAGLSVTPAQLLIRYQIDSGHLAVVKASSAARLWDNLKSLSFELTSTQLDDLNALNRNKRTYTFRGMGDTHRHYPFKATF